MVAAVAAAISSMHTGHSLPGVFSGCCVRTCFVRLPASPNAAAQWGHAWSLRFSCTVRTCVVRLLAWPNAAAQWGHAWSLRFTCPLSVGVFESKVLGGDQVWVVEWIVRTCVPR